MDFLMPAPAVVLVVLISLLYAALFHLWRGKGWGGLVLSIIASLLGMIAGQFLGPIIGLDLLRIGQVYILEGTVLAWLLMLAVAWLRG